MQDTIYSAIFVDFDNIFLGLTNSKGAVAANSFATDPAAWLRWLARYTGAENKPDAKSSSWLSWLKFRKSSSSPADTSDVREIIVRRCYLNPHSFWKYRQSFVRSGFEVVDCPSLTQQKKSAADIRIVLDIMDLLQQRDPVINEFIIMSGDADFTPVVLRLRQRGRRIMVMVARHAASAYLAAANAVIDSDEFERNALSDIPLPDPEPITTAEQPSDLTAKDLSAIDKLIKAELAEAGMPIRGATVAQKIANRFNTPDWFGYGSFRSFMEERLKQLQLKYAVQGTRDYIYDPTKHANPFLTFSGPAPRKDPSADLLPRIDRFITDIVAESAGGFIGGGAMAKLLQDRFGTGWYGYDSFKEFITARAPDLGLEFYVEGSLNRVIDPARYAPSEEIPPTNGAAAFDIADVDECIRTVLAKSDMPILGAQLGHLIAKEFDIEGWFGYGRFKSLMTERADLLQLVYAATRDGRTWIFDPNRHMDPREPDTPQLLSKEENPDLLALVAPIAEASGLPLLRASVYEKLFTKIVEEFDRNGYEYKRTVQAVREQLNEDGEAVTDLEVGWVLEALELADFSFNNPSQVTPANLSFYYHFFVSDDIKARIGELDGDQEALLRSWLRSN